MEIMLAMFKADGSRRDFYVAKERMVIGRQSSCDLRIPLSAVSREHCEVRVVDGVARLKDMGSSNGTYHNNLRVQEAVLQAGDELVIGPVVFKVVIDGQPSVIDPVRTILHSQDSGSVDVPIEARAETQAPPARRDDQVTQMMSKPAAAAPARTNAAPVQPIDPYTELAAIVDTPGAAGGPAADDPLSQMAALMGGGMPDDAMTPNVVMDDPIAALEAMSRATSQDSDLGDISSILGDDKGR